jgi:hypothetical protein
MENPKNVDIPCVLMNQVRDTVVAVVEDAHLPASQVVVPLPESGVFLQHPHGIVDCKRDALGCVRVIGGDLVVDVS